MFDSEATLNMSAADLGANLPGRGLTHKREFSRLDSESDVRDEASNGHRRPCTWSAGNITSSRLDGNDDRVQENARYSYPQRSAASPNVLRKLRGEVGRRSGQSGASVTYRQRHKGKASRCTKARRQQRPYNLQLDSKLPISTKRRHTNTEPTDEIGPRTKDSIMPNLWLFAQIKQPGRSIYKDFDKCTFMDFLDKVSDRDNFNINKEVDGRPHVAPKWSYCFSYELELQKEAIKLCRERHTGIEEALWSVLGNTGHWMKHWLQLVAIPNAPESVHKREPTDFKKRMAAMENRRARPRSPRRQQQRRARAGPSFLALPAPASSSSQPVPAHAEGKRQG